MRNAKKNIIVNPIKILPPKIQYNDFDDSGKKTTPHFPIETTRETKRREITTPFRNPSLGNRFSDQINTGGCIIIAIMCL